MARLWITQHGDVLAELRAEERLIAARRRDGVADELDGVALFAEPRDAVVVRRVRRVVPPLWEAPAIVYIVMA